MFQLILSIVLLFSPLWADGLDPYRWLEIESPEQREWIAEQNGKTELYLDRIDARKGIEKRIQAITDYDKKWIPQERGGVSVFLRHRRQDDRAILVCQKNSEERIICNPNLFQDERSLIDYTISPSGKYVAYGLSLAGSDQQEWHIIDLRSYLPLDDVLTDIQFSPVIWDKTENSLFYIRNCKELLRHKLGTPASEDELIYESPEETFLSDPELVLNEGYILVNERPWTTKSPRIILVQLFGICLPPYSTHEIHPAGEEELTFIGEGNGELYFISDANCCYQKLVTLGFQGQKEIIPEQQGLLQDAAIIGHRLVCSYYKNATAELKAYDLKGNFIENIPLPDCGTVFIKHSKHSPSLYYLYTDFKTPVQIYYYDFDAHQSRLFFTPQLNFDPSLYETEQRWFKSRDGTEVPFFLTRRKDLPLNEKTPVLMFGYGGFGISVTPFFRPEFLAWLESGGVLVVPSLRGGKEFGKKWHEAGMVCNKQNVFDDCIAAAEYLEKEKIGTSQNRALYGTSNGGLLAGACLTQRTDLFRAVIVNKGVLDMLRYPLFTIGKYWISEYGDPEIPEIKKYLLQYSPYHQVKKGSFYPAILVNTADHDDRVVPFHSFKFAAALQEATASRQPVLLRIEKACGHGGVDSKSQEIAFGTDLLSFLFYELELLNK